MADPTEGELTHEELSDAVRETEFEILDEAFNPPEKGEAEPEPEPEEPEAKADEQPRDEQGKFAAKEAEPEPKAEEKAEGKEDATVPSWRLREIAEERRAAQAERDQLRAELTRLQMQQRQPPQEQKQPEQIDPLLDPQGFANRIRADFDQRLRETQLNANLAIAEVKHGETFQKAFEAVLKEGQNGNRQLVNHLTSQANPGEAIVSWFKQQELVRETNGDINAYRQKMRDELLKDPEFIKAAVQAAQQSARGNGQQQPRHVTQLPPSLSRATGSSQNSDPIDTDDSDRSVFDYAFK